IYDSHGTPRCKSRKNATTDARTVFECSHYYIRCARLGDGKKKEIKASAHTARPDGCQHRRGADSRARRARAARARARVDGAGNANGDVDRDLARMEDCSQWPQSTER